MANPLTPDVMKLFHGNDNAYGKFIIDGTKRQDGKVKGRGVTQRGLVTQQMWDDHLLGKEQLGIIPITEDSVCKFAAIDIDDYTVDKDKLNKTIFEAKLPLIVFRSKSGGAHIYMFLKEWTPAPLVQAKMKQFAAYLGHGNAEIFPKQIHILKERGDLGQWINMPYFNLSDTNRYAYRAEDGQKLNINNFLIYVQDYLKTRSELEATTVLQVDKMPHGPPCLQHLISEGFPDGTRNEGLFNLGVYAKKANPDKWKPMVEEYNNLYMEPPLAPVEVLSIIKSLDKKAYNFNCKKQPLCAHCNATLCRNRKYGIGEGSGLPTMGSLTKMETDPPIWFIDVENGSRLELSTEELQNTTLFQRRCLAALNIMPPITKRDDWQMIIKELLDNVQIIEVPHETTYVGALMEHIEDFCKNRPSGETIDCLLRGQIWTDSGFHHFRFNDFMTYLERRRIKDVGSATVVNVLKKMGAKSKKISVGHGKQMNVYMLKEFGKHEPFTPPALDGKEIPF